MCGTGSTILSVMLGKYEANALKEVVLESVVLDSFLCIVSIITKKSF